MSDKTGILIANFLRIAREDLSGARVLAAHDNRNAVYLLEQAAEKVIRAILTSEGVHAGIRHSLRQMVDEGVPETNPLRAGLVEIAVLEDYATAYRYPTPAGRIPSPPKGERLAALADRVDAVLGDAAGRFGVDLSAKDQPAHNAGPLR